MAVNETFEATMTMLRAISRAAQIKISRNWADYVADQLRKASNRSSLLAVAETFAEAVQADMEFVGQAATVHFMARINAPDASNVVRWIRAHHEIAAALLTLKTRKDADADDFFTTLKEIAIPDAAEQLGTAMPHKAPMIPLVMTCLSPLAHGADMKAGNSTLFRRIEVLSTTGQTLCLPALSANAFRGIMRDEIADDFTVALGFAPQRTQTVAAQQWFAQRSPDEQARLSYQLDRSNPPYSDWFFAALYGGGKLEENSAEAKALSKELGTNGTMRVKGIHRFRDMIPPLSVMGVSLGNRILCRHGFDNCEGIPRCAEWNTGKIPEAELLTWMYQTRRDDSETRDMGSGEKSAQMIANTEVLKLGTVIDGGIDVLQGQTDVELSCVGRILELFQRRGKFGAENRRWLGNVSVEYPQGIPDSSLYQMYLAAHREEILAYLQDIGALRGEYIPSPEESEEIHASGEPDLFRAEA